MAAEHGPVFHVGYSVNACARPSASSLPRSAYWPPPRSLPASRRRAAAVTCETVRVPMRDGVLLATDVYRPAAPGRYPVILQRTPYGFRLGQGCFAAGLSGAMAFWAEHGYVGVSQDARGTYRSEGEFNPIFQEQADGYDAVEWAAAEPLVERPGGHDRHVVHGRHAVAGRARRAAAPSWPLRQARRRRTTTTTGPT